MPAPARQTETYLRAQFVERIKAVEAATGVRVTVAAIDGGIRMEATAITQEAKLKFRDGKWAVEIRNFGSKELLVTSIFEFGNLVGPLGELFRHFPPRDDAVTAQRKKQVEQLVAAPEGTCQML